MANRFSLLRTCIFPASIRQRDGWSYRWRDVYCDL
jgi:hypothetical protein